MSLEPAVARIRHARRLAPPDRAVLVAVSGIDAGGKGHVTARIAAALEAGGLRVAVINVDGWLNLPHLRFSPGRPATHFYDHAIRFEAMFARLVTPLRERRSVRLAADYVEETATTYRPHVYQFEDVDVILLEGIFLLKPEFRGLYDVSIWIDCSFETALERAIARGQEGLPPEATRAAYRTIYLPAQRIHFERDGPREAADLVLVNDARLAGPRPAVSPMKPGAVANPGRPGRIEGGAGPDAAGPPGRRATVTAWSREAKGAAR